MSDYPVSGPGEFAQRTDQQPGQPVRVPTGLPYGQAKQLEQAQQAVPVPAGPGGPLPPSGPQVSPQGPPAALQAQMQPHPQNLLETLSHPTERPYEAVTTPNPNAPGQAVPLQQVIQTLETIIAHSDHVPENVMRLYQGLRQEANAGPGIF